MFIADAQDNIFKSFFFALLTSVALLQINLPSIKECAQRLFTEISYLLDNSIISFWPLKVAIGLLLSLFPSMSHSIWVKPRECARSNSFCQSIHGKDCKGTLLDLGSRDQILKKFIGDEIEYEGCDMEQNDSKTNTIVNLENELPFSVPVIQADYAWHWNDITCFSTMSQEAMSRHHVRLAIYTDGHLFVYVCRAREIDGLVRRTIDENRIQGRTLLIKHVSKGNFDYITIKNDSIKTRD